MIYRIGPAGLETKALEVLGAKHKPVENSFQNFLKDALQRQVTETNDLIRSADKKSMDFVLGKVDNIADVMMMQEIANASLQFTVQLRNSFLEAYHEIMRLQV